MGFQPTSDGETSAMPSVLLRSFGFARDGVWDTLAPSAALAQALEDAAGRDFGCPGASRDEQVGMLKQWAALEAYAAAGRLGTLRAMAAAEGATDPRDKSLAYEAAQALAVSVPTAQAMFELAGDLHERLPGIKNLLTRGGLAYAKARAVSDVFAVLSLEDAARAETLILDQLPGKNYGQVLKLAWQAAITVDPDSATRRREDAEREQSRVEFFREESGAAGLSGRDLPTDAALAADGCVSTRAQEYKASGVFPGERLNRLRAAAYLDLLNEITAEDRIAAGVLPGDLPAPDDASPGTPGADDDPGHDGPGAGPGGPGPEPAPGTGTPGPAAPGASQPRRPDLIFPLVTLLGLAQRSGEGYGLGPLDPGLCRALAAAAAASPHSTWCVTVVDWEGIAIGHGCTRPPRTEGKATPAPANANGPLAARINLTIPVGTLNDLARRTGPPSRGSWSFTRERDPGPPDGFGRWTITLPGDRQLTVALEPMPTFDCDHRHESRAYQPNDKLRHLVQVRDYECTFPMCSRHARDSDFEHARPHDKGGRTCACNAGSRSRACHQVKQSKGWKVTQPRPGWHEWTTPAGRIYTQGPKRYPA